MEAFDTAQLEIDLCELASHDESMDGTANYL